VGLVGQQLLIMLNMQHGIVWRCRSIAQQAQVACHKLIAALH
jgi:hypothetical protein